MQFLKKNKLLLACFFIGIAACAYWYPHSQMDSKQQNDTPVLPKETTRSHHTQPGVDIPPTEHQIQASERKIEQTTTSDISSPTTSDTPESTQSPTNDEAHISVTLRVPSQGVDTTMYVEKGATAYTLMEAVERAGGITFSGTTYGSLGFLLESIGGISTDYQKKMYWIYYINNKKATIGLSNYVLNHDDIITWQYEPEEN